MGFLGESIPLSTNLLPHQVAGDDFEYQVNRVDPLVPIPLKTEEVLSKWESRALYEKKKKKVTILCGNSGLPVAFGNVKHCSMPDTCGVKWIPEMVQERQWTAYWKHFNENIGAAKEYNCTSENDVRLKPRDGSRVKEYTEEEIMNIITLNGVNAAPEDVRAAALP